MTSSLRTVNRLLLVLIGIGSIAVAATLVIPGLLDRVRDVVAWPTGWAPYAPWIVVAVCVVGVSIAVAWILSRGRGRTSSALREGGAEIDSRVITQVLQGRLSASADVVHVQASAFVRRRRRLVKVTLQTRRHPDLASLIVAIRRALSDLDDVIGVEIPLIVHVTTGARTALSRTRATH